MPVEITEVVIQVSVDNAAGGATVSPPAPAEDRQAIVAECVERVLEVLRQRQEP